MEAWSPAQRTAAARRGVHHAHHDSVKLAATMSSNGVVRLLPCRAAAPYLQLRGRLVGALFHSSRVANIVSACQMPAASYASDFMALVQAAKRGGGDGGVEGGHELEQQQQRA
jgi:hypothetical protein